MAEADTRNRESADAGTVLGDASGNSVQRLLGQVVGQVPLAR
jgi:hypothetical protein